MKSKRQMEAVKRFEAAVKKLMETPGWEQALIYELSEAVKSGKLKLAEKDKQAIREAATVVQKKLLTF